MHVVLRPEYRAVRVAQGMLIVGETKRYLLKDLNDEDMAELETLTTGGSTGLGATDQDLPDASTPSKLMRTLESANLLTSLPSDAASTIESKQLGYLANSFRHPMVAQKKIGDSRVAVFGLGGTGINVVEHLVGAGVSKFILIDGDHVALDNLNRQYAFRMEDVGEPKAKAAATYVLSKRADADLKVLPRYIESRADVRDALGGAKTDLAVVCLDRPIGYGSDLVTRACWDLGVPSLFGGVGLRKGFYGPVYSPRFSHKQPKSPHRNAAAETRRGTPYSFGPTNSLISSLMAAQAIHHLAGDHDYVEYNNTRNVDFQSGAVVKAEENSV